MIAYVPDTMETIANYMMVFLAFPFFIGLVFFVHELGHYYAARFFNTQVERFSIGVGWKIWERADKKERYGGCALFLLPAMLQSAIIRMTPIVFPIKKHGSKS